MKEEIIKKQFRKQFLNACRDGKIFAINFGSLEVDLECYLDEKEGLHEAFFDYADFTANPDNYVLQEDRLNKNKHLEHFPLKKDGFGVVLISNEESKDKLESNLAAVPNIFKFGKLYVE